MEGVTVDTNTSQLVSLGGRWQHSLNIVDTRLDTSGQFRRVRGSQGESGERSLGQGERPLSRTKTLKTTVSRIKEQN